MTDRETGNPAEYPDRQPGRNGGWLRRGGINPNAGRPPARVRLALLLALEARLPLLEQIADDPEVSASDRLRAIDLMLRYGLGTTVTETDTNGNDASARVVVLPPKDDAATWTRRHASNGH